MFAERKTKKKLHFISGIEKLALNFVHKILNQILVLCAIVLHFVYVKGIYFILQTTKFFVSLKQEWKRFCESWNAFYPWNDFCSLHFVTRYVTKCISPIKCTFHGWYMYLVVKCIWLFVNERDFFDHYMHFVHEMILVNCISWFSMTWKLRVWHESDQSCYLNTVNASTKSTHFCTTKVQENKVESHFPKP